MIFLLAVFSVLFMLPVEARNTPSFEVLIRRENSTKTYFSMVQLPHLENKDSFDGKYFKIVKSKDETPIRFDESNEELLLKAANVYYHLNQARDFWVNEIKSQFAKNLPKIVIRLEIINQFDEIGHFANDNRLPQYNNALSIPGGKTPDWVPADKKDSWGNEIWFRPLKKILTSELGPFGPNPLTTGLQALEDPLLSFTQDELNLRLMEEFFYPAYVTRPLHQDLIRYAGTIAVMKLIIHGSKYTDKLFMDKYYYLDTAMVPEIIYHEYAHVVLSESLQMSHSTPVIEGLADYFAAVQADTRKVYAKVPGYSNAQGKDRQEKQKYTHWNEANRASTSDFTLSVLWDVRETLGEKIGDEVVYEARRYLKTNSSNISDSLLRAIVRACEIKCDSPRRDKYKLYETFSERGF